MLTRVTALSRIQIRLCLRGPFSKVAVGNHGTILVLVFDSCRGRSVDAGGECSDTTGSSVLVATRPVFRVGVSALVPTVSPFLSSLTTLEVRGYSFSHSPSGSEGPCTSIFVRARPRESSGKKEVRDSPESYRGSYREERSEVSPSRTTLPLRLLRHSNFYY